MTVTIIQGLFNVCEVSGEAELTTAPVVTVYRYRGAHAARLMRADRLDVVHSISYVSSTQLYHCL